MRSYPFFLLLTFLASAALSFWSILHAQAPLLRGNVFGAVCVFLLAIITFVAGLWVLGYKKSMKSLIEVRRAYRVVCLANSAIFTGGLLFATWLGTLLGEFQIWQVLDYKIIFELLAIGSAVALTLSGISLFHVAKLTMKKE
ncbi:MAG: hypothetical protein LBP35_07190 [Candidatus Ancillula trichonymphae]|jgi:hypothetical protein|nr:hypothetical protein [Candidatus Ancillula trichonymphae]